MINTTVSAQILLATASAATLIAVISDREECKLAMQQQGDKEWYWWSPMFQCQHSLHYHPSSAIKIPNVNYLVYTNPQLLILNRSIVYARLHHSSPCFYFSDNTVGGTRTLGGTWRIRRKDLPEWTVNTGYNWSRRFATCSTKKSARSPPLVRRDLQTGQEQSCKSAPSQWLDLFWRRPEMSWGQNGPEKEGKPGLQLN